MDAYKERELIQAETPRVSVIIPVFKVERFLDSCVSSVVEQTYHNLEIILIDDGSPDRCPALCDAWSQRDERIRVLHQQNKGLSAARNAGLDAATGEYVLFVDSDDAIDAGLVEKCLMRLRFDQTDIVLFKHVNMTEKGDELSPYRESERFPQSGIIGSADALSLLLCQSIHSYAQLRMVKKALYDRLGFTFPVGRTMEDLATTFFVLGEAGKVSVLNEELYRYRQRGDSIVGTWSHGRSVDTVAALDDLELYIRDKYSQLLRELINYKIKMLLYCWMCEPCDEREKGSLKKRRADLAQIIFKKAAEIDECSLTKANRGKLLLLRFGLLGVASRIVVRGHR